METQTGDTEMDKLIARIEQMKTAQIKEACIEVDADLSDEATIVLDAMLSVLAKRLPEAAFVAFVDGM
jgi:hypothetical protein